MASFDQSVQQNVHHFGEHDPEANPDAPLPSVRSQNPSASYDGNPDHALIHPSMYMEIKHNNHHIDFDHFTINPVIKEILKKHPLAYTLSQNVQVPMIYLQQAWKTITFIYENNQPRFDIQIDEYVTSLNYRRLRLVLRLPEANSRPGKTSFDPYAPEDEVLAGIRQLGYLGPLDQISQFNKANLPPTWYALFFVLGDQQMSYIKAYRN